ncbi:MAG: DUF108 domain-containing protein [Lachnospiraceae bacterium]|jgi:aspartate dehydrogenase|nr:DUF108 domain-containing protein [Lachnospiraceae bacterium]MCI1328423.1 DUF108 domain-containing protein [Lachnospiraceae bacterium]
MSRVGFLGCGKIGMSMLEDLVSEGVHTVSFVQDPFWHAESFPDIPSVSESCEEYLQSTDLVVECATADVLKKNIDGILKHADLLTFSVTAFADDSFCLHVRELVKEYGRRVYLPHGAILGVDGIADGRGVIREITIETVKNPKSLGRTDTARTVLFDGRTREACGLFPRNVNVHATVALAGIGFDRTRSRIISDPAVSTNSHHIKVAGDGIRFEIQISSEAGGGVTGKYTPYSAIASLHRILDDKSGIHFV